MTGPIMGRQPLDAPAASSAQNRLRKASQQFEAVFINEMFKEMRATVPSEEGSTSSGQEMFTGLLDEKLANEAAAHSTRGLGEALYRQLAARLSQSNTSVNGSSHGNGSR